MAQLFEDEKKYPDNRARKNFVFLGYPYTPAIPAADYKKVVKELEEELPVRFWYFLDEVTTEEMMRKVWRAILRADLAFFDVSDGNANVAFELGLAAASNKRCMTLLKTGAKNPLGSADLGYAERSEYDSATALKERLRGIVTAKSSAMKMLKDLSYELFDSSRLHTREQLLDASRKLLNDVFNTKAVSKTAATKIFFGDKTLSDLAIAKLRAWDVLEVTGKTRGAKWVLAADWVYHDHEVAGE